MLASIFVTFLCRFIFCHFCAWTWIHNLALTNNWFFFNFWNRKKSCFCAISQLAEVAKEVETFYRTCKRSHDSRWDVEEAQHGLWRCSWRAVKGNPSALAILIVTKGFTLLSYNRIIILWILVLIFRGQNLRAVSKHFLGPFPNTHRFSSAKGDDVAQRKRSCFPPSRPGFDSDCWLKMTQNFALWTWRPKFVSCHRTRRQKKMFSYS